MTGQVVLAGIDAKDILHQFLSGRTVEAISKELSVSDATLYGFIIEHEPELWKQFSAASALADLDRAARAQLEAPDGLSLARARAAVDLCKWRLERLMRKYFGQDAPQSGNGVQINIGIGVRSVDDSGDKTLTIDVPGK